MLVMSQNTWFPNQDKNAIIFFFSSCVKDPGFFDLSSVDLISKGLLHTFSYTAAIVLCSRAKNKPSHHKMYYYVQTHY